MAHSALPQRRGPLKHRFPFAENRIGRKWLFFSERRRKVIWWMMRHGRQASKRVFDVAFAIVALVVAAPLMLLIGILVRIDGGPVLFRQERVGQRGELFQMWKFRSMCVDAENRLAGLLEKNEKKGGVTFKLSNDPRVTTIGRLIRKTSLDELPQLFNVLRGQMSVVGPRPPVPVEVAKYDVGAQKRLLVKPGLTCFWQVGEIDGGLLEVSDRNRIGFEDQVRLDVDYIEKQSFWLDLKIILKTPPAMLLGK